MDPVTKVSLQSELTPYLEPFASSLLMFIDTTSLPHAAPTHSGVSGGLVTDAWPSQYPY